jgi:hypothetical protein
MIMNDRNDGQGPVLSTPLSATKTPNEESLQECGKTQNRQRDLVDSVKKASAPGLDCFPARFIVGFDHDPPSIFEQQIRFIQQSGIVDRHGWASQRAAGTRLFERLKAENRLLRDHERRQHGRIDELCPQNGSRHLESRVNRHILRTVYAQKAYYNACPVFAGNIRHPKGRRQRLSGAEIQLFSARFINSAFGKKAGATTGNSCCTVVCAIRTNSQPL